MSSDDDNIDFIGAFGKQVAPAEQPGTSNEGNEIAVVGAAQLVPIDPAQIKSKLQRKQVIKREKPYDPFERPRIESKRSTFNFVLPSTSKDVVIVFDLIRPLPSNNLNSGTSPDNDWQPRPPMRTLPISGRVLGNRPPAPSNPMIVRGPRPDLRINGVTPDTLQMNRWYPRPLISYWKPLITARRRLSAPPPKPYRPPPNYDEMQPYDESLEWLKKGNSVCFPDPGEIKFYPPVESRATFMFKLGRACTGQNFPRSPEVFPSLWENSQGGNLNHTPSAATPQTNNSPLGPQPGTSRQIYSSATMQTNNFPQTYSPQEPQPGTPRQAPSAATPQTSNHRQTSPPQEPQSDTSRQSHSPDSWHSHNYHQTPSPDSRQSDYNHQTPSPDSRRSDNYRRSPSVDSRQSDNYSRSPSPDSQQSDNHSRSPSPDSQQSDNHSRSPSPDSQQSDNHSRSPSPDSQQSDNHSRSPSPDSQQSDNHSRSPSPDARQSDNHSRSPSPEEPRPVSPCPVPWQEPPQPCYSLIIPSRRTSLREEPQPGTSRQTTSPVESQSGTFRQISSPVQPLPGIPRQFPLPVQPQPGIPDESPLPEQPQPDTSDPTPTQFGDLPFLKVLPQLNTCPRKRLPPVSISDPIAFRNVRARIGCPSVPRGRLLLAPSMLMLLCDNTPSKIDFKLVEALSFKYGVTSDEVPLFGDWYMTLAEEEKEILHKWPGRGALPPDTFELCDRFRKSSLIMIQEDKKWDAQLKRHRDRDESPLYDEDDVIYDDYLRIWNATLGEMKHEDLVSNVKVDGTKTAKYRLGEGLLPARFASSWVCKMANSAVDACVPKEDDNDCKESDLYDRPFTIQMYKANFKAHRSRLAQMIYDTFNYVVFKNQLPRNAKISWTRNVQKASPCFIPFPEDFGALKQRELYHFVFYEKLIDRPERLCSAIIHEMAHLVTMLDGSFNSNDLHNEDWKFWVDRALDMYPFLPDIPAVHPYKCTEQALYICVQCGYNFHLDMHVIHKKFSMCLICNVRMEVLVVKYGHGANLEPIHYAKLNDAPNFLPSHCLKHVLRSARVKVPSADDWRQDGLMKIPWDVPAITAKYLIKPPQQPDDPYIINYLNP